MYQTKPFFNGGTVGCKVGPIKSHDHISANNSTSNNSTSNNSTCPKPDLKQHSAVLLP